MSYTPVALGFLPGGSQSQASCISSDSTTIGGYSDDGLGNLAAVIWDGANTIHRLPEIVPAHHYASQVTAMSADASVIVGIGASTSSGVIWFRSSGYTQTALATLGLTSFPFALSADGAWAVGGAANVASGAANTVPSIWDANSPLTTPVQLQRFVNQYPTGQGAFCVNANGSIVFGSAAISLGSPPFPVRWTSTPGPGVIQRLDTPAGSLGGAAVGCTPDGIISVGYTLDAFNVRTACYWTGTARTDLSPSGTQATGVDLTGKVITIGGASVSLNAVIGALPALAGGSNNDATGVSYPGTTIAGWGFDSLSRQTAIRWTYSGASPPPFPPFPPSGSAVLRLDNLIATSLATESPCTVAQYATPPPLDGGPVIGLRWSDTRGQDWGNAIPQALSTDELSQLQWNRTGYARDRVFELFWSAALKTALNGAFIIVEPWKS